jgi:hypothetical protein
MEKAMLTVKAAIGPGNISMAIFDGDVRGLADPPSNGTNQCVDQDVAVSQFRMLI